MDEDEGIVEEIEENHINMLGVNNEDTIFLNEEEQGIFTPYEEESLESIDYKQGFENAIMEVHKQYDLRSKKNQETPKKKTSKNSAKNSPANTSKNTTENSKAVTRDSDKNKGKNTQIYEKHSGDPNSISTSSNAPNKTILTTVHNKN